jgi:hypothetical protein
MHSDRRDNAWSSRCDLDVPARRLDVDRDGDNRFNASRDGATQNALIIRVSVKVNVRVNEDSY